MERFDYQELNQQMQRLARTAAECPNEFPDEVCRFLSGRKKLPSECADIVFWVLTYDLAPGGAVQCFDWYTFSDVYQKLTVEHENIPAVVLEYLRRHPEVESEELSDFLWFATLYRLAVQNAWQLSCTADWSFFRLLLRL